MVRSSVPSELEAKLLAPSAAELRGIARLTQLGPYVLRTRDVVRLYSLYLDTAEPILARHGVALRLRRQRRRWEATVKWSGEIAGALHERPELTVELAARPKLPFCLPSGPLRLYLDALVAGRPLAPILVTDIRRRRLDVLSTEGTPTGTPIAELALDTVRLQAPDGGSSDKYYEVEIERCGGGQRRDIKQLARLLRQTFALLPSPESKLARGLRLVRNGQPTAVHAESVRSDDTVEQAARKIAARHLFRLRTHDPGTRLGEDPEALHDMRVASRRLRALLRAFAPAVPPRARAHLSAELRWLGQLLGTVRDLDVQLANLLAFGTAAPPGHRAGLEPYRAYIERERTQRREVMLAGLDSERYFRLLRRLEAFAHGAPRVRPSDAAARELAAVAGRRAIKRACKRLLKRGKRVHTAPTPEDLHALRIRAKRLRYLLEFLRELTGKPGRRLVKRLVRLQDLLGAHHDAVVAAELVRQYVEGPGKEVGAAALLALGALVGSDLRQAEHARAGFQREWRCFARKRTLDDLSDLLDQLRSPPTQVARDKSQGTSCKGQVASRR